MTELELVEKVLQYSSIGRILYEGDGGYNIKRGGQHNITSYLEDIFALYMAQKIANKDLQFLVCKLIAATPNAEIDVRPTFFQPSLLIVDKNVATHYYDIVLTLEWNEDIKKSLAKRNELIQIIKGKKGWIRFSNEEIQYITFSPNLKYQLVTFNGWSRFEYTATINEKIAATFENIDFHKLRTKNFKDGKVDINMKAFESLYFY